MRCCLTQEPKADPRVWRRPAGTSQASAAGSPGPSKTTVIIASVVPAAVVLALALGAVAFLLHRRSAAAGDADESSVLPSGGSQSNKVRCSLRLRQHCLLAATGRCEQQYF